MGLDQQLVYGDVPNPLPVQNCPRLFRASQSEARG